MEPISELIGPRRVLALACGGLQFEPFESRHIELLQNPARRAAPPTGGTFLFDKRNCKEIDSSLYDIHISKHPSQDDWIMTSKLEETGKIWDKEALRTQNKSYMTFFWDLGPRHPNTRPNLDFI